MESLEDTDKSSTRLKPILCDLSDSKPTRPVDKVSPTAAKSLSPSSPSSDNVCSNRNLLHTSNWNLDTQQPDSCNNDQPLPFSYQLLPSSSCRKHEDLFSCSNDQQVPSSCSSELQEPTSCSSEQLEPTSCNSEQLEPTSSSNDQQELTSCSSDQQELATYSCSSVQQEPTSCSSEHLEPTSSSSDQQELTSCSSDQQELASCSSVQQEPTSCSSDLEPSSCSSYQPESTSCSTGTSCNSDQQEHFSHSSNEQESTSCGTDQTEPSGCINDQKALSNNISDHQEPVSFKTEHQEPFSCVYNQPEQNRGNHDQLEQNGGNYDQLEHNTCNHDQLEQNRGNHDQLQQNRGNHDQLEQNRGNHDQLEQTRCNHDQLEQNRGNHYQLEQNRGNHDQLEQDRENHDQLEQNRGNHDQLEQNGENHDQLEQNRGNHDHLEQNRGNYDHLEQNRGNHDQPEGIQLNSSQEIPCGQLSFTSDVISANYQSSGFDSLSGLWDFDINMTPCYNTTMSDPRSVTQSDFSESVLRDGFHQAATSPTAWRSWTSDAYIESDLLPLDKTGCNWYSPEVNLDLNQSVYCNVPSFSSTPQRFGQDSCGPSSTCNQSAAPTLRIPDLSQFNVEPNKRPLSPTEEQLAQFQGSAFNFLNNIPSLELPNESSQDMSLETESSNQGYVSPTEFLNSPNGSSQFSSTPNLSSEGQTNLNHKELNFSECETNLMPSLPDSNDNWQQFTLGPAKNNQQENVMENQHNIENILSRHQSDYSHHGFSDSGPAMQQFTPNLNVSYARSPVPSSYTQISFSVPQNQENVMVNFSGDREQFNLQNNYVVNQCSTAGPLSGFQETFTSSKNISNNRSFSTPSNSGVVRDEQCYSQQTIPPVPPLHYQGKHPQILYRHSDLSPFPQMLSSVSYHQQLPHHMNTRPQISRPGDHIPSGKNGNIMFQRPVSMWNDMHTNRPIHNPSTYQNFYNFRSAVNPQMEPRRDSQMYTQSQSSSNMDDPESKPPIALLPIPEHFIMPPYSCQVEQYARNYPSYTAIQPYSCDGPSHSLCSEQNRKCFPQKHGAVSIKTKEGKFLCMASDFHTKTVREILDSAETCKERANAAKKDEDYKMDVVHMNSNMNHEITEACSNIREDVDHSSPETNMEDEIICVTDSESLETGSIDGTDSLLDTQSTPQERDQLNDDEPAIVNPDLNSELLKQNLSHQECNSISSKDDEEIDVLMTDDIEDSQLQDQTRTSAQEQSVTAVEAQKTEQFESDSTEPIFETQAVSRSPNLPPASDLLHSASTATNRQSSFAYPGKELLYRGPIHRNTPVVAGHHSPHLSDLPPSQDHHSDRMQHLVFNPGGGRLGYYNPMLPSREVQLSTAQPYPLLPSMFQGPSYPPISHPYFVPHAPSYHSGYNFLNSSSLNRDLSADVRRIGPYSNHGNTDSLDDAHQVWREQQAHRDRLGIHYNYPQTPYQYAGLNSSTTSDSSITPSNFIFSKKLQDQRESLNKIAFKPKHFEFTSLQIGNYKYSSDTENKTAKLKLLYSKKKIVYEFQLNEVKDMYEHSQRKLALVEIPFDGIVQLSGKGREFKMEVSIPPKVYQGEQLLKKESRFGVHCNAKFNRCLEEDMTDGEIHHIPYHYIHLKGNQLDKLTHYLELYDKRFEMFLHLSFVEEPGKLLGHGENNIKMTPVTMAKRPPTNTVAIENEELGSRPAILKRNREMFRGCHCQAGCTTGRCSCSRSLKACSSLCQCCNCANLFNSLNIHKISTKEAKEDSCLLNNLFKVVDLRRFLKSEVMLPCCNLTVSIRQCIPGETGCPNYPRCLARYKFSWCSGTLCDQAKNPRNHCKICKSCCGKQYRHCGSCNRCYFAGFGGFSCPTCNSGDVHLRENQPMNMLSDADIIRNILPT